jgi:hypothetical protein
MPAALEWKTARSFLAAVLMVGQSCASAHGSSTVPAAALQTGLLPGNEPATPSSDGSDFAGFRERCSHRGATCFVAGELAERPFDRISDFLVRVPGIVRRCPTSIASCVVSMRSAVGPGECNPVYFLDGSLFRRPEDALVDLEQLLRPVDLRGIEVYATEHRPTPFVRSADCGSIVLWTKR